MKNKYLILPVIFFLSFNAKAQQSIGIEIGQANVVGDIESKYWAGKSLSITYDFYLTSSLYLGASYFKSKSQGLGHQPIKGVQTNQALGDWFPNYKNNTQTLSVKAGYQSPSWHGVLIKTSIGIGLSTSKTFLNYLDENNQWYETLSEASGFNAGDENYLSNLDDLYDSTYETMGLISKGEFGIKNRRIHQSMVFNFKILKQIGNHLSIGLAYSNIFLGHDLLDGFIYRASSSQLIPNDYLNSQRLVMEYGF